MQQKDFIPSFQGQGCLHTPVPNDTLSGNSVKFNGSILLWEGRRLLAYRRYDYGHGRTNLAISVLDDRWKATGEHYIPRMPCPNGNERHEDVRLFVHKGRLWISCSEIYKSDQLKDYNRCSQRVFRLDKNFNPDHTLDIKIGHNFKATEKNWAFFSHDDRLFFFYDYRANQVFEVDDKSGVPKNVWESPRFFWRYGHLRGGTAPQLIPGSGYLTFIHSSTVDAWLTRRYSMSALVFEEKPPFRVLAISEKPLCYGTRYEDFCNSGNGQCIFPSGQILEEDGWHVSCGINDTFNTVFHFRPEAVVNGLVPLRDFYEDKTEYWISQEPRQVPFTDHPRYPWTEVWSNLHHKRIGLGKFDDLFALEHLAKNKSCSRMPHDEWKALHPKNIPGSKVVTAHEVAVRHENLNRPKHIPPGIQFHRGEPPPQPLLRKPDGRIIYK